MGMTIEEARTALGQERKYALHENKQAFDIAINTMRKYQKIQEIINNTDYIQEDVIRYKMICEVIEDGNGI